MMYRCLLAAALATNLVHAASQTQTPANDQPPFSQRPPTAAMTPASSPPSTDVYVVPQGTRILLNMVNSVNTKATAPGDRLYLETAFPVLANGKIVVPQGSWVTGTITSVKRAGRVHGRAELGIRFDSIILPNGSSRTFNGDLASIDARDDQRLKRETSTIKGASDKSGDVGTVARSTTTGTIVGSAVGAASGNVGRGLGVGAAGGAAIGLATVLLTRGPEAELSRGAVVEMVVDRPLQFSKEDVDFTNAPPRPAMVGGDHTPPKKSSNWSSRLPL